LKFLNKQIVNIMGVPLALLGVPPPKGSAAFAPPNIGGVSEGRGGFGALRIPHAQLSLASLTFSILFINN
jgi:hypothetical protein